MSLYSLKEVIENKEKAFYTYHNTKQWKRIFYSKEENSPEDFSTLSRYYQKDLIYLKMAHDWSISSYCERKKVGVLVVKNDMIISDGYNGTPTKFDNVCEINNKTKPEVLHAEANAITKIAKSTISSEGAILYSTLSPCFDCSKLIIQSGISRVVFSEFYDNIEGLDLLIQSGIKLTYIPQEIINKFYKSRGF